MRAHAHPGFAPLERLKPKSSAVRRMDGLRFLETAVTSVQAWPIVPDWRPRMATPYSQDLRDRVLAAYDRGLPTQRIAELFAVSKAWARRLKQRRRETGETAPRPMGGATVIKIDMA